MAIKDQAHKKHIYPLNSIAIRHINILLGNIKPIKFTSLFEEQAGHRVGPAIENYKYFSKLGNSHISLAFCKCESMMGSRYIGLPELRNRQKGYYFVFK